MNRLLQIQTEIAYVSKYREELIGRMEPKQRKLYLEYFQKLKEKVSAHFESPIPPIL